MIGLCVPAGAAELRDVRVWASPDSTRIVFDLSGVAAHSLFTLDSPNRVVIDLDGTQLAASLPSSVDGKGLVQRVRSAPRDGGGLRVVLDVSQAVTPKSFSLEPNQNYGYRVVIDLSGDAAPIPAVKPQAPPASLSMVASAAPPLPAPAQPGKSTARPEGRQAPVPSPSLAYAPQASKAPALSAPQAGKPSAPALPPPPRLAEKPIVIAIDAGHGGEDPGTSGRRGVLEKDVALSMARRLAGLINREPGLSAVLIRDGDYYIGLKERTRRAQKAHADLFVSIHANSFKDPNVRGTAVYVLSPKGASSEHAAAVENRENMADLIGGVTGDMDDTTQAVLADIVQTSAMEASHDAGGRLLESMGRVNVLQKRRVQQASFVVLKSATFPSVLVETAFLTNDREERSLADPSFQDSLAHSMLDGIKGYFHSYRPLQQVAGGSAAPGLTPVALQSAR
jgi:N-acetylmuramoyl-L-alanine amidase